MQMNLTKSLRMLQQGKQERLRLTKQRQLQTLKRLRLRKDLLRVALVAPVAFPVTALIPVQSSGQR